MTKLHDKVVAVTGAGSGIGRALALELAQKGARLALSDVNAESLRETAALLTAARCTTHTVDVRAREAVEAWADEVVKEHGQVDAVINNAGVAVRGSVEKVSYEDFAFVIDVNLWGVVHGVKAFLPHLRKRPEGHIVNIASINAMVPFALNGPYNASKYAVLGLSETLMQELDGESVRVTCVHPGGVRTNIVRSGRGLSEADAAFFDRVARTSPRDAARTILQAVEQNRERVYVGTDSKIMAAAKRLMPDLTVRFIGAASRAQAARRPKSLSPRP